MSGKSAILVADGDLESLRLLQELLTEEDHAVRLAGNGELALAFAEAEPPDLILLDVRTPRLSGFDVCRRLKAGASTRDIPIIFLGATCAAEDLVEGFRLGAVDFVMKPLQREELLVKIASHLELHRLRMHLEQRLAAQKLESLGALAAGIAHNFNNLLAVILSESDLVLSETPPGSQLHRSIERISAVTNRAAEIVDLLLAYSGSGEPAIVEAIDVSAAIEEMSFTATPHGLKPVIVDRKLSKNLPPVWTSRAQIQRVVMNLVTNAWEALAGEAGAITVTTELINVCRGSLPDLKQGDYVRITVSDSGPGLSEDALAKIFDPFYTTKFLGRGLGLSVVHGIVRSMNGTTAVSSAPGQGAAFQVLLPCAGQPALAVAPG